LHLQPIWEETNVLLLLLLILLLCGGGWGGYSRWGYGGGMGIVGLIVLFVILAYVMGGGPYFHHWGW
jgi:hypothetical protein